MEAYRRASLHHLFLDLDLSVNPAMICRIDSEASLLNGANRDHIRKCLTNQNISRTTPHSPRTHHTQRHSTEGDYQNSHAPRPPPPPPPPPDQPLLVCPPFQHTKGVDKLHIPTSTLMSPPRKRNHRCGSSRPADSSYVCLTRHPNPDL